MTLSEALTMAQRYGPGFEQARLGAQSRELESALADARKSPVLTVTERTELQPYFGQSLSADLQWTFHDDFKFTALVGRVWRPDTSTAGGGSNDKLTLSFSRKLWPRTDAALEDRIDSLGDRIADLNESHAFFDAHVAVVEAFGALDQALRAEALAVGQLELAVARTRIVTDGFAAGDRGLKELQDAQHAERQALVARRNAATARVQAALGLHRLLGDQSMDKLSGAVQLDWPRATDVGLEGPADGDSGLPAAAEIGLPPLALHDDLAWCRFIDSVQGALAEAGDGVFERLLASDTAYLNAELAEWQAIVARDNAESGRGLQWDADASYTMPLSDSGAHGELTAFIGASWTWSAAGGIRAEQAELALAGAELRTGTARQTAMDGAAAALRMIDDAAFAKDVAEMGLEQARATMELVERRAELGFAGPLDLAEARLDVERARAERSKADSAWHNAWLDIARRFGLPFPGSS